MALRRGAANPVENAMKTELLAAIAAFNTSSQPEITVLTTRDGRTVATLPRLGQEITVGDATMNSRVKVTVTDMALLCEEARLASAPGLSLLDAALAALRAVAKK